VAGEGVIKGSTHRGRSVVVRVTLLLGSIQLSQGLGQGGFTGVKKMGRVLWCQLWRKKKGPVSDTKSEKKNISGIKSCENQGLTGKEQKEKPKAHPNTRIALK